MTMQGRGPLPRADAEAALRRGLLAAFRWRGDRTDDEFLADPTGWWADPQLLAELGPALAALFSDRSPTLVLGPASRGVLLGALVATHLGVGLAELRKQPSPSTDSDCWLVTRTPPDYRDLTLELGVRRDLLVGHRVLLVDDWIATGGQALGARDLVRRAGATWCGAAVVVDALHESRRRRDLDVRSLLMVRDL